MIKWDPKLALRKVLKYRDILSVCQTKELYISIILADRQLYRGTLTLNINVGPTSINHIDTNAHECFQWNKYLLSFEEVHIW